jgi:hypothetical protein
MELGIEWAFPLHHTHPPWGGPSLLASLTHMLLRAQTRRSVPNAYQHIFTPDNQPFELIFSGDPSSITYFFIFVFNVRS